MKMKDVKQVLKKHDIQPTNQRGIILNYLMNNYDHPSCDKIYDELSAIYPIMNRATIYNSLNLFVEKGILSPIYLNDKCRYEIKKPGHGHFICQECQKITDFSVNLNNSYSLDGYEVLDTDITFRGICPLCLEKKKEE